MDDELLGKVLCVGRSGEVRRERFERDRGDPHLINKQAFSKVGDDEMNLVPADEELIEHPDSVDCARSARNPEDIPPGGVGDRWIGRVRLAGAHGHTE